VGRALIDVAFFSYFVRNGLVVLSPTLSIFVTFRPKGAPVQQARCEILSGRVQQRRGERTTVATFKPSVSDLEILLPKSLRYNPVWVQHAFECTMWGDYFFYYAQHSK